MALLRAVPEFLTCLHGRKRPKARRKTMKTAMLLITVFGMAAGARAAELNTICAADIKAQPGLEVPAIPAVRLTPGSGENLCEAALAKELNFRQVVFRDAKGTQLRGFDKAYYTEYGPLALSLVLQTAGEAYYYYEDCDICAEIDRCDLKTGEIRRVVAAHSADCSDLPKVPAGAVYNACPAAPACSAIGEAVRIPEECCSKHAVPAYGGEMECVEAPPPAGSTCAAVGDAVRIPEECCSGNAVPAYGGEMECVEAARK